MPWTEIAYFTWTTNPILKVEKTKERLLLLVDPTK
jgi:hypothetical protein